MTIGLLLTSCKKNETPQTETAVPTEAVASTPADTTKTAVAKDTSKSSEKSEKEENEKNEK